MSPPPERLDSWKAIADYLQRDQATVRRWEKGLGLPVRRVAGTGRSVFAYTSEIDAWLQTSKAAAPVPETLVALPAPPPWRRRAWVALSLGAVVLALIAGLLIRPPALSAADLRVQVTTAGVVAHDAAGVERWRFPFPAIYQTALVQRDPLLVTGGKHPDVYFATAYRGRQVEDRIESGTLTLLDMEGRLQRSFSFDDQVTFRGKTFAEPWAVMSFAVDETSTPPQVAVAGHHYTWDPGLVTVLDENWRRRGTFVHAGWIEVVRWVARDRLLIGGFSNAHDGGMVSLLDSNALDGQGPEPAGSPHHCDSCPTGGPLRMFVFPRSELNRVTGSRFNRVLVVTNAGRISVRTVELSSEAGDADAHYEFTPTLDFISARFSERYWELHRALEAEGRVTHSREQCPDRDGPRALKVWDRSAGWQTIVLSPTSTAG
jgi:hypothetical protein